MASPSSLNCRIIYEDNHLVVVNKLPSEIVQGDKTGDVPLSEMVKQYLKEKYQKPGNVFLGVVHRIDRPVSGGVIFARTSKALSRLNEMLKKRELTKKYWAVVKNSPAALDAHLVHYLFKNEKQNKSYVVDASRPGAKRAELQYHVAAYGDNYHLLEIELLTGRHHQIRAQLAAIGCPIRGDLKYGFPRSNEDGSIHLHARELNFLHPVKKETLKLTIPVPKDPLWDFFEQNVSESSSK
jgi:23S rRNA pseudouridine1911/1915/1917 synthase